MKNKILLFGLWTLLFIFIASAVSAYNLSTSLAIYQSFDQFNTSGDGNTPFQVPNMNASQNGSKSFDGFMGLAVNFTGKNSYMNVSKLPYNFTMGSHMNYTFNVWYKTPTNSTWASANGQQFYELSADGTSREFLQTGFCSYNSTGRIITWFSNRWTTTPANQEYCGIVQGNTQLWIGWHMITITMNSTNVTTYIDGVFRNATPYGINSSYNVTNLSQLWLANSASGTHTFGFINNMSLDEFGLWNRTLPADEVLYMYNLYNSGLSPLNETQNTNITFQLLNKTPGDIDQLNVVELGYVNVSYSIIGTVLLYRTLYFYTNSTGVPYKIVNGTQINLDYVRANNSLNPQNNYSFIVDFDDVYPGKYNYEQDVFSTTPHISGTLTNTNQLIQVNFLNVSNETAYNYFEVMFNTAQPNNTGGDSLLYYCNSSYVASDIRSNVNCVNFFNFSRRQNYTNHTHTVLSSHALIPFYISAGKIGSVYVTPNSSFAMNGNSGNGWQYWAIANVTEAGRTRTLTANGGTWANYAGTLDSHIHQWNNETEFKWYACGTYTNGTEVCDPNIYYDKLQFDNQSPTAPTITSPIDGYWAGVMNITWNASTSPLFYGISYYNVSLYNSSGSFIQAINDSVNGAITYQAFNTSTVSDGVYYIIVRAVDASNATNSSTSLNFTIDNTAPVLAYVTPTTGNASTITGNISVNVTMTDANPRNLTIYLYNSSLSLIRNYSVFNYTGATFYANVTFSGLADGTYYFNATGFDMVNSSNRTQTYTVTLSSSPPQINFVVPTYNSSTTWGVSFIIVNVSVNSTAFGNVTIYLYNSTGALIKNVTNTTNSTFYYVFTGLGSGTYYFNATAIDTSLLSNSTETRNVTIDVTNPIIYFDVPYEIVNGTIYNPNLSTKYLNITANDSNIYRVDISVTYNYAGPSFTKFSYGTNTTNVTSINRVFYPYEFIISDGELPNDYNYNVTATAYDFFGRTASVTVYNFMSDIFYPSISFVSPNSTFSGGQTSNNITFNLTYGDVHFSGSVFTLYNSTGDLVYTIRNSTSPNNYWQFNVRNLSEGVYYFNASASDLFNHTRNTSQYNITIKTSPPRIQLVNNTDANNSYLNRTYINVNTSVNDSVLNNITIFLYNASSGVLLRTATKNNTLQFNYTFTGLPDEYYFVNASTNDNLNHTNKTQIYYITVDTINPSIVFNPDSDSSGTYRNLTWVYASVTTDDMNTGNITLYFYNSTLDLLYNTSTNTSFDLAYNLTGLANGVYYFNATTYDKAGNFNETETRNVTIDTISPVLQFVANTTANNSMSNITTIAVNVTMTDVNPANITIRLYNASGSLLSSYSQNGSQANTTFTVYYDGYYYFNATGYDLAGNSNKTQTYRYYLNNSRNYYNFMIRALPAVCENEGAYQVPGTCDPSVNYITTLVLYYVNSTGQNTTQTLSFGFLPPVPPYYVNATIDVPFANITFLATAGVTYSGYLNRTYTNLNMTSNITVYLPSFVVAYNATEKFTNKAINANFSAGNITLPNNTYFYFSDSEPIYIYFNTSGYLVYRNSTVGTGNHTGTFANMTNSVLNVTLKPSIFEPFISTFNATVCYPPTGVCETKTTTNGQILFNMTAPHYYNITIKALGYNDTYTNYTFYMQYNLQNDTYYVLANAQQFSVGARYTWDNGLVEKFNVNYTDSTGNHTASATGYGNATIITNATTVNLTIYAVSGVTFYPLKYFDVPTNANTTVYVYPSQINFTVTNKFNNTQVFGNISIQNVTQNTTEHFHLNLTNYVAYFNTSTYLLKNVSINLTTLTNTTYTIANVTNAVLNISNIKSTFDNTTILDFNARVCNINGVTVCETLATGTGTLQFNITQNLNYSVNIYQAGYGQVNRNITVNSSLYNLSVNMTPAGLAILHLFNASSGAYITPTNMTILVGNQTGQTTYTTITGRVYILNLTNNSQSNLVIFGNGFTQTFYDFFFVQQETVAEYFINVQPTGTATQNVQVYVYRSDSNGLPLTAAQVTIETYVNGSFGTVQLKLTDVLGQVTFPIDINNTYRVNASYSGYDTASFTTQLQSPYIYRITLQKTSQLVAYNGAQLWYDFSPQAFIINQSQSQDFNFTINSTDTLDYFSIKAYDLNFSLITSNVSTTVKNGTLHVYVNTTARNFSSIYLYYEYKINGQSPLTIPATYYITNNVGSAGSFAEMKDWASSYFDPSTRTVLWVILFSIFAFGISSIIRGSLGGIAIATFGVFAAYILTVNMVIAGVYLLIVSLWSFSQSG